MRLSDVPPGCATYTPELPVHQAGPDPDAAVTDRIVPVEPVHDEYALIVPVLLSANTILMLVPAGAVDPTAIDQHGTNTDVPSNDVAIWW